MAIVLPAGRVTIAFFQSDRCPLIRPRTTFLPGILIILTATGLTP